MSNTSARLLSHHNRLIHQSIYAIGALLTITTGAFAIWPSLAGRLFASNFLPHLYCYLGRPRLVWTHVVSDSLIALSYLTISVTLGFMVYRGRRDIPFGWMFLAFGLFIIACGGTHFMEIVTVWLPVYVLSGGVKVFTALASLTTAVCLPFTVPRVLALVQAEKASEQAHRELELREAELAEAQRLANVGSWKWDPETDTVTWSQELYRIVGRDPHLPAVSYKDHHQLYTAESWQRLRGAVEKALQTGAAYELDLEMIRTDYAKRWIRARGEALRDDAGRVVRLRGTAQDITDLKLAEEAIASVNRRLIEAQEQERARIARDLHDDVGQSLSLLVLRLDQIKETPAKSPSEAHDLIEELAQATRGILSEVQSLAHQLHSSKVQYLGIVAAIKAFCGVLSAQHKVEIVFTHDGRPLSLSPEVSLCVFRVLQEALHNAVRHSNVRNFHVQLCNTSDELCLTVMDAGIGFDPETAMKGQGLGLISMRERMKLVEGTIAIESRKMGGTTIIARVPLRSANGGTRVAG